MKNGNLTPMIFDGIRYVRYDAALAVLTEARNKIGFLKGELDQLANFNPDWDMLQATRESLREHQKILVRYEKALNDIINMESCLLADAKEIAKEARDE